MSRFAYVIVVGTVVLWVVMAAYDTWFWGDKPVNRGEPAPTRRLTLVNWIFLTVWVSSVWLWYYYADTRPEIPHPETENIYELNTHGSIAYLTLADRIVLWGTMAIGLGGGIAANAYAQWRRTRRVSRSENADYQT